MSTQNAIEMVALTKRFGSVTAVDGVDLAVRSGSVFGLLGPNGAGKSTMIDLVLGLKTPTEGQVSVFGTNMTSDPRPARHRIGVLPEQYDVYDGMSGREHIRTFLRLKDADDDPERLCDAVGLSGKACDRPAGDYSKGMQQRLVLATALAGDPDLLILDEPTSGLDPEELRSFESVSATVPPMAQRSFSATGSLRSRQSVIALESSTTVVSFQSMMSMRSPTGPVARNGFDCSSMMHRLRSSSNECDQSMTSGTSPRTVIHCRWTAPLRRRKPT
ncbi:ABC transporter ATP-binding protein [Halocatena marina]|uniref:ABC transporter ATP-binding protein n=1 Tax=Halocatena marina TaxID=2934937 RepID=A0ABD5YPE1_9EURY